MDKLAAIAIPVITAVITALTATYLLRSQRRKLGAEAESLLVGAAGELVKALQTEVARLCLKVDALEAELGALEQQQATSQAEMVKLRGQVEQLQAENGRLKQRVAELEAENRRLAGPAAGLK